MDKVVVIGGAGFVGGHVVEELTRRGYKVTVFDKVGCDQSSGGYELVLGDMLDLQALSNAVEKAKYVYHFGGVADIAQAKANPFKSIEDNVLGVATALEACRNTRVDRFLYASTVYVYSPYGSFYRASKQAAETLIEAYSEQFKLDHTLLRYGSLYGPRAQEWNGLRKYVSQVLKEGRLVYEGTGQEMREYIHVRDAARLSVDVLGNDHRNEAVTLTGTQVLNSNELAEMIFEIAGIEKNVTFTGDDRDGEHYRMTPYRFSPKRARKLIPSEFVDLGQGILEIFEEVYKESDST